MGGDHQTLLQPIVLHLSQRCDGGEGGGGGGELGVRQRGAGGVSRAGGVWVGAAQLRGEAAAVRVGHRRQAAAQGRRVQLGGVGAAPLQELDLRAALLVAPAAPAATPPKLSPAAALVSRSGGFLGAAGALALHAAALTAGCFEASERAAAAAFVQAAADAAVPHLLQLRLHICLDFQTVVPVKDNNTNVIIIKQSDLKTKTVFWCWAV